MHDDNSGSPFKNLGFWTAAISGALLSLIVTGYAFPVNNNIFHLPIVGRLYDQPEFADDIFIQSLQYYSSGIWMMLAGSAELLEPRRSFLLLLFLSRLLSFVGFLACADHLGIREAKQRFLTTALIAMMPFMQGASYAGDGGLFLNSFTHSEIGNGLFLIATWAVMRRQYSLSFALIGIVFFTNAFFGVWLAFVLVFVVGYEVIVGRLQLRRLATSVSIGFVVSLAFMLPVISNIVSNPEFGKPIDFNYIEFLEEYYPIHFLIWTVTVRQAIGLVVVLAVAGAALARLQDPDRRVTAMLVACVLLYVIGMVVPWLTESPFVLNLHLLRSGVLIHLLSSLLLSTLVVRWWFGSDRVQVVLAAFMMVVLAVDLVAPRGGTLIYITVFIIIAYSQFITSVWTQEVLQAQLVRFGRVIRLSALVTTSLLTVVYSYSNHKRIAEDETLRSQWTQVADWALHNTSEDSIFMVADSAGVDFEFLARRSIWVDFKRGAAVMWFPSYYKVWNERTNDMEELQSIEDRTGYARLNDISYIVEDASSGCGSVGVFSTEHLCVARIE